MARASHVAGSKLRLVQGGVSPSAAPPPALLSIPTLDDNELLGAVRSGDEAAATAFYHRVFAQVDATIARMLGRNDADLQDVAQVSFIELVRSVHRFRGECSLDAWVSRVTAHVVCKQIRRRRLERIVFARSDGTETSDDTRTGPALVAKDLLERIREHLGEMNQDRVLAFLLHDVCGFDLREAARMLEVSVAAAQKRLVRGRRELRERLARDPELADLLAKTKGDSP